MRNLSYESPRTKTSEYPKGNRENTAWYNQERASWIREQTKVEDILTIFKRKNGERTDYRWTVRITEWQPWDGERKQDRQN